MLKKNQSVFEDCWCKKKNLWTSFKSIFIHFHNLITGKGKCYVQLQLGDVTLCCQCTGELTPDGIDPTVVEDSSKTFPECSSFCSWGRWHLLWLPIYWELRPPLPKAGERIVRDGSVYWIWVLFPLPHSSAQKSIAACSSSESFSPRGALSFLLRFCSGKCGRGS